MIRAAVALLLALLALSACRKASEEQCTKLCWRYNEINYWERFEKDAAALAPDAREKLRSERQTEWDAMKKREFDPGLENCQKECRRSAKPEDAECVERAKTAADAKACLE